MDEHVKTCSRNAGSCECLLTRRNTPALDEERERCADFAAPLATRENQKPHCGRNLGRTECLLMQSSSPQSAAERQGAGKGGILLAVEALHLQPRLGSGVFDVGGASLKRVL